MGGLNKTGTLEIAVCTESAGRVGEDRAGAFPFGGGTLLVVADGAGGTSGGAEAAQLVVDALHNLDSGNPDWTDVLHALDQRLGAQASCGETTAVVAFVHELVVVGASVGDSGAWLIADGEILDLTERQQRKPLLGSERAAPVSFGPVPLRGRLLLASDGLLKYANAQAIARLAQLPSVEAAAAGLIEAARLPSGSLQDDITVIIAGGPTGALLQTPPS